MTEEIRLTVVFWTWGLDIQVLKREFPSRRDEGDGKIDMGGSESAGGAVPLYILICLRPVVPALFFVIVLPDFKPSPSCVLFRLKKSWFKGFYPHL
jgi:hypothetical protein